jgi:hypothetical protein
MADEQYKPEWRDFEKRFREIGLEAVPGKERLDDFPSDVRKAIEDRMRERYRRFEREDEQDRSTPGYDSQNKDTQHRYLTRVEFMLDDLAHHIREAQNPPERVTSDSFDPEKVWAKWQGGQRKLGRHLDDWDKIVGWSEAPRRQVDKLRDAIRAKAKQRQGRERDHGREH